MPRRHRSSRATGGVNASAGRANATAPGQSEQTVPSEERESARARGPRRSVYAVIPTALALLTSVNTLWNDFAADDQQQVLNNALIKDFGNVLRAFTTSVWSFTSNDIRFALDVYYRPIFNVLLAINYALFGIAPWGWHLTNAIIHTVVALLVYLVLKELTDRRWLALIAAALFAVHPVHAESIAWVSGVTDPLLSVFLLSAFYFYIKYRRTGRNLMMAATLVLSLLAVLSKETALALPLIVAYCELAYFTDSIAFGQRFISAVRVAALFALPFAVYFLMRYLALGTPTFGGEATNPLDYAVRTIPLAFVKYIKLILVPFGYSFQHYTPLVGSLTSPAFFGPLLVIAGVAAAVWLSKSRLLTFAAAWFAIWLAPSLAVLRQYDLESLVQERFLYLPSVGFCLAVALGIEWLGRHKPFGLPGVRAAAALVVAIVALWSAVLIKQNRAWRTNVTLYESCVAVDPKSAVAHSSLGNAYSEAGRSREADEQLQAALALDPQCLFGYLSLSYRADRLGQVDQAIKYLLDAVATVPEGPLTKNKLATIYLNLGRLYEEQKKYDIAEQHLLRSIEMWPRPVGWYYAGLNYYYQERYDQALAMYQEVIRHVPPNYAPIHLSIAAVYESLNRMDEARAEYHNYLELAPPEAPDRQLVEQKLRQLKDSPAKK